MIDTVIGLLTGVAHFYLWTVGIGLVLLAMVMLAEGLMGVIRDWVSPSRPSQSTASVRDDRQETQPRPAGDATPPHQEMTSALFRRGRHA